MVGFSPFCHRKKPGRSPWSATSHSGRGSLHRTIAPRPLWAIASTGMTAMVAPSIHSWPWRMKTPSPTRIMGWSLEMSTTIGGGMGWKSMEIQEKSREKRKKKVWLTSIDLMGTFLYFTISQVDFPWFSIFPISNMPTKHARPHVGNPSSFSRITINWQFSKGKSVKMVNDGYFKWLFPKIQPCDVGMVLRFFPIQQIRQTPYSMDIPSLVGGLDRLWNMNGLFFHNMWE